MLPTASSLRLHHRHILMLFFLEPQLWLSGTGDRRAVSSDVSSDELLTKGEFADEEAKGDDRRASTSEKRRAESESGNASKPCAGRRLAACD
ncbi:unnamed protein product, partial [Closterium sp. NIES-54]